MKKIEVMKVINRLIKDKSSLPVLSEEQKELKETYIRYADQFIGDMNNARQDDKFGIILRFKIDINKISREYERERKNEKK